MKIQIGETYINRTWTYLVPTLKGYGPGKGDLLFQNLSKLNKLAVGIHDTLLDGSDVSYARNLYFLLNNRQKPDEFWKIIEFFRTQDYYQGDYIYGANIDSPFTMLVLKVPERFHYAFDMFIEGKYSQMYTEQEINAIFHSSPKIMAVLKKDLSLAGEDYLSTVNNLFSTRLSLSDLNPDNELDIKPLIKEEVFNTESQTAYFLGSEHK